MAQSRKRNFIVVKGVAVTDVVHANWHQGDLVLLLRTGKLVRIRDTARAKGAADEYLELADSNIADSNIADAVLVFDDQARSVEQVLFEPDWGGQSSEISGAVFDAGVDGEPRTDFMASTLPASGLAGEAGGLTGGVAGGAAGGAAGASIMASLALLAVAAVGTVAYSRQPDEAADRVAPVVLISVDRHILKADETALVTFTFSEVPQGFTAADIRLTGGSLSGLAASASDPKVYSAIFTPTVDVNLGKAYLQVAAGTYADAAGLPGEISNQIGISYDTDRPLLTITSDKPVVLSGETATITFSFSEIPVGFDASDVDVTGGVLSGWAVTLENPQVYQATFNPSSDPTIRRYGVSVGGERYTDLGGNTGLVGLLDLAQVEIQALPAIDKIAAYAEGHAGNPSGTGESGSPGASGAPTVDDYLAVGVSGVTLGNVAALNAALAGPLITGDWVRDLTQLQAVVDAYDAILDAADGGTVAGPVLTSNQLWRVGVDAAHLPAEGSDAMHLLADAVDQAGKAAVDTPEELIALADAATLVQDIVSLMRPAVPAADVAARLIEALKALGVMLPDAAPLPAQQAVYADMLAAAAPGSVNGVQSLRDLLAALPTITLDPISTFAGADGVVNAADRDAGFDITGRTTHVEPGQTVSVRFGEHLLTGIVQADGSWRAHVDASRVPADNAKVRLTANVSTSADVAAPQEGTWVAVQTVRPVLTIRDGTADTATGAVTYTFAFDLAVTGFTAGDIDVSNGTRGLFRQVDDRTYTLAVTPLAQSEGTDIGVRVSADVAQSLAGNGNSAALADAQAYDTRPPTLSISRDLSALKAGETALITFAFSEDPGATFTQDDIAVSGGTLSEIAGTGLTRTATFTPTADLAIGTASITVLAGKFTDAAGNVGGEGTTPSIRIDTRLPTLAISSDVAALKANETATITFTFSEDPGATFEPDDIEVSGGTLGAITGSGLTRTATFTPTSDLASGTANINVPAGKFTDAAGNVGGEGTTPSISIDTKLPTLAISSDVAALKANETATITFSFSEDPGATFEWDGTTGDIEVSGGTLGAITGSGLTRTATFTPTADLASGTASISVPAGKFADAAGNVGGEGTTPSISIDTKLPTLAISSDVAALMAGQAATITFTFSEDPGSTFESDDIEVLGGTLGAIAGSGLTRTTSFTPTADLASGTANISVLAGKFTDAAGNVGGEGTTPLISIDTKLPTLAISSDVSKLKAGETATITFTFSEDPGTTFEWDGTTGDIEVSGGTLGAITGTGLTRTATFTPTADLASGTASITVLAGKFNDAAGNAGGEGTTPSISIDTKLPTLAISSDVSKLKSGETATITFTFSEDPGTTFESDDIEVLGGTLGSITGTGLTRIATFTPTADLASGTASITVLAGKFTDAAGNAGGEGTTPSISIDTKLPTLAITSDVSTLKAGETATITFTFSEDPSATFEWDGTTGDIEVSGGTLGAITGTGLTRTATFTPTADLASESASISVQAGKFTDAAGNAGGEGTTPSISIDTRASTLAITSDVATLTARTTAVITFTFSEDPGTSFAWDGTDGDIVVSGGTLGAITGTGLTRTASFTPKADTADGTASITVAAGVYTDAAGNKGGAGDTPDLTFDTLIPTVTDVTDDVDAAVTNGVITYTVTFSEALSVTPTTGHFSASHGKVTQVSAVAGSSTKYTVAVTPDADVADGLVSLTLKAHDGTTRLRDAAGNTVPASSNLSASGPLGSSHGATQGIDTLAPSVLGIKRGAAVPGVTGASATYNPDNSLNRLETDAADDAVTFHVTFSESVTGLSASSFALKDLSGNAISALSYAISGSGADWTVTVSGLNAISGVSGVRLELDDQAASIRDEHGNLRASASFVNGETYTVDPSAPGLASLTSSTTVGTGTPLLSGRTEAGALVSVAAGGATFAVTANGSGIWTVDTRAVVDGGTARTGTYTAMTGAANNVTVTAVDAVGNSGNAASYVLAVVSGTPAITTGGISNDATPVVSGTTSAAAWVRATIGGATYDVQADSAGNWTFDTGVLTPTSGFFNQIANGNYAISAQSINASGGTTSGARATASLLVDTLRPNAPTITSSGITREDMPTIKGTASADARVRVSLFGSSYEVLANAAGDWTLDTASALASGTPTTSVALRLSGSGSPLTNSVANGTSYPVNAREVDAAGNLSLDNETYLTYDDRAPADPILDAGPARIGGSPDALISGTGEAGAQITLWVGGARYQSTVDANGRWSVATASQVPTAGFYIGPPTGGSVTVQVRQTDVAGNINAGSTSADASSWSVSSTYTHDEDYPAITSSGLSVLDKPVIVGTGPVGSLLDVEIDTAVYQVTAGTDGAWRVDTATDTPASGTFRALSDATSYPVTAKVSGTTRITGQTLTVDLTLPSGLRFETIALDDVINLAEKGGVNVSGGVEPGSSVTLSFAGRTVAATVLPDGTWRHRLSGADHVALGESSTRGDKTITATARDKAGNVATSSHVFTVDTLGPQVVLDRHAVGGQHAVAMKAKNVALSLDNGTTPGSSDASVVEVNRIATVKISFQRVTVAGSVVGFVPQDGANEQLLIGDQVISLDGTSLPTQLSLGGEVWYIDYAAGDFTLTAAKAASAETCQAMLRNIRYINKDSSTFADDDNRVFTFTLTDQAGNVGAAVTSTVRSGAVAPLLDLDADGSSGGAVYAIGTILSPGNTPGNVTTHGFAATLSGTTAKALVDADATLVTHAFGNSRIGTIELSVSGVMDGALEMLVVNGATGANTRWAIDGSVSSGGFTQGGKGWTFSLDAASRRYTFVPAGGAASQAEGLSLIKALQYEHGAGSITDGARSLSLIVSDGAGNTMTTPAESVLSYRASAPAATTAGALVYTAATRSNSNGQVTMFDANADGVMGDTFRVHFTERVNVASLQALIGDAAHAANLAKWVVSAGGTLGTGATITPVGVQMIKGERYAAEFEIVTGSGASLTTGSTVTVSASSVIDTTGTVAAGAAVFTLTDIVAPVSATAPFTIGSATNTVNTGIKAASTSVAYQHAASESGGSLSLHRDGQVIKTINFASAGLAESTFTLSGNDWGDDGIHQFTVVQRDAAGNLSAVGAAKGVTVDTGFSGVKSLYVSTDANNAPSAGDVLTIVFNEPVSASVGSATLTLPAVFGSGATAAPVDAVANKASTYRITLGASPTISNGTTVNFTGLSDVASNTIATASITATDLYAQAATIVVANVGAAAGGASNVIDAADKTGTGVTVNFTRAAANGVVRLMLDGEVVASHVLTLAEALAGSYTFAALDWGSDGTRSVTSSLQLGSGQAIGSDVRKVMVSTEQSHWSRLHGVLWFDPEMLVTAVGSNVSSWGDASGRGVNLSQAVAVQQPLLEVRDGRKVVLFNGSQALTVTGNAGGLIPTGTSYEMTMVSTLQVLAKELWRSSFTVGATGSWSLGITTLNDTGATDTLIFDAAPGSIQADGSLGLANSLSFNQWAAVTAQAKTSAALAQVYSNGNLQMQTQNITLATDLGSGLLAIGAKNGTGGAGITAFLGDQIFSAQYLNAAARMELEAYTAAKYGGGITVARNGLNVYDLSDSALGNVIVDNQLDLSTQPSADTVTVAGADHVNLGAGADTLLVRDLKFRSLDGGQGFDTLALHPLYSNAASGNRLRLSDHVSNARGELDAFGSAADDTRVNANGFHKLMGFERIDLFQANEAQTVQISLADIDQLAGKNLAQGSNVTVQAGTSNLFLVLGSQDWLDVPASALGRATYGHYQDATGTAYDRRYSGAVGTDTATLYVRGGDDAPDFGATSTAAVMSASRVVVDFNEVIGDLSGLSADWSGASAGSSITGWSTSTTAGKSSLTLAGTFNPNAYLDVTYTGSTLVDSHGEAMRYKGLAIGIATVDRIDLSGKSAATNSATGGGYAIFGNDGPDTVVGTAFYDLIVGGAGNDTLGGGLGADTFRAIQFEAGIDTVTDFSKSQGDKVDLRGILKGTALDGQLVWKADGNVDAASLTSLLTCLELSRTGNDVTLKVDDSAQSAFSSAGFQMVLQGANVAGNLATMDLEALVNQRVFLV